MAWIESHQELLTNPKTRRAAKRLGLPCVHLAGHLHALWWWALDHAFDGDLSGFDAEDLADAAEWDGDPDELVKALVDCGPGERAGFLEVDGPTADGRTAALVLHDWGHFTAHLRARRDAASHAAHTRWHVNRRVVDPQCRWCQDDADAHPTQSPQDAGASPGKCADDADAVPTHAVRNAPNLTEPNRTEPKVKGGASRERSARAQRLPDGWTPADDPVHEEAKAAHVDLRRELDRFRDYWRAQGGAKGRKVDWQATWRNWVRRAVDDRPRSNGARDGPSHADRYRQAAEEARRREVNP